MGGIKLRDWLFEVASAKVAGCSPGCAGEKGKKTGKQSEPRSPVCLGKSNKRADFRRLKGAAGRLHRCIGVRTSVQTNAASNPWVGPVLGSASALKV